tara:strand:+ start:898 stop:1272 length:375 start_codon:yes stop_codon:yes gene_type:complete
MTQRVKWISTIKQADAKEYQPETPKIIKKDVIEKGVESQKARYIVVKGVHQTVSQEVKGKPSVIKETVIQEDSPYVEQSPELFQKKEFDCEVSELQDYGKVKYYRCDYGKIRIPENAIYYDDDN